ncbi:hypothetical protein D3C71_1562870 [compost metagenome]
MVIVEDGNSGCRKKVYFPDLIQLCACAFISAGVNNKKIVFSERIGFPVLNAVYRLVINLDIAPFMYAVHDKHAVVGSASFKRFIEVLKYSFYLVESDASFTVQLLLGAVILKVQNACHG